MKKLIFLCVVGFCINFVLLNSIMGNKQIGGKIFTIKPYIHNSGVNGYEICITGVDGRSEILYLLKNTQNYVELLKYIKINKSYTFECCKDIYEKYIIMDITGFNESIIRVKIMDFVDLSQHSNKYENMFELIHDDVKGPKLITKNIDDYVKGNTYDITYKYMNIFGYCNVMSFEPTIPMDNKTLFARGIKNSVATVWNYYMNENNNI